MRLLPALAAGVLAAAVAAPAVAKPSSSTTAKKAPAAKKKYYFTLDDVHAAQSVTKPEDQKLAGEIAPTVKDAAQKLIAANPQLVAALEGAPDPTADAAGFSKFLSKSKIDAAYRVTVEITGVSEGLEPVPDKPSMQRIAVYLEVHMFGEAIPSRKMGFTGDGSSTVKEDIGKTLRPKDRDAAWQDAATEALTKALDASLAKLSAPPPKPSRK